MIPGGKLGPQLAGAVNFYIVICRENSFKIFSKPDWPEKLKLVSKHPQVVITQVCSCSDPQGRVEPQWGSNFLHRNI